MPLRSTSTAYLRHTGDLAGNPGQQAAYDSRGHCIVLAGPGSGKTKTLVLKLAPSLGKTCCGTMGMVPSDSRDRKSVV